MESSKVVSAGRRSVECSIPRTRFRVRQALRTRQRAVTRGAAGRPRDGKSTYNPLAHVARAALSPFAQATSLDWRGHVKALLALSRAIDAMNAYLGRFADVCVVLATVISAGNAMMRYAFDQSSNAWLEIQWYLFGAIFLLAAGYTLKHNGHVRIDIIYGRFSARTQAWIDLLGSLLFLLPLCGLIVWLAWPGFVDSFVSGETSPDAGGLIRWPVRLLIPLGFALLALQGVAEIIKRIAFLRGEGILTHERPREEV
jgi:TRAP-type mannitol/chloroaromatic compound transport system permease small subunit